MNLSFDTSPSAIPGLLWAYYVQYLWNYESDSWVARIAYSCRILAILVSLPLIILGLLVCTEFPMKSGLIWLTYT